jgi:hypothetical protein
LANTFKINNLDTHPKRLLNSPNPLLKEGAFRSGRAQRGRWGGLWRLIEKPFKINNLDAFPKRRLTPPLSRGGWGELANTFKINNLDTHPKRLLNSPNPLLKEGAFRSGRAQRGRWGGLWRLIEKLFKINNLDAFPKRRLTPPLSRGGWGELSLIGNAN